tara:strand:+ start:39 stop:311 length:273 start_codon:yes stop_codon:yes gene_type:complete
MAKKGLHRLTVQEANNAKLGQAGSVFIDDTAVHTGPFVAFIAITEAVLDVSDCTTNIDDAADFTIPIGTTIYGFFESLSIGSGSILAYKG